MAQRMLDENVCHRPDGLEEYSHMAQGFVMVCHRPDGLEDFRHDA